MANIASSDIAGNKPRNQNVDAIGDALRGFIGRARTVAEARRPRTAAPGYYAGHDADGTTIL